LAKQEDDKYIRYPVSNDFSNPLYDAEYQRSVADKEGFWTEQAQDLKWHKPFTKVLD
jgi:acetyl-CoA synthetase